MAAQKTMKILHTVEFYNPSTGGAQEVVRQISEELVRRGHGVTVATTNLPERKNAIINGVRIESFAISGNCVRGCVGETARYQEFLMSKDFDVMLNYAAQQWATDLAYPILHMLPYRKLTAPCGFSGLFDGAYESYFRALPNVLRKYDHLIFHSRSGQDMEFTQKHGIRHCSVIPNGASLEEFKEPDLSFRRQYGIPPGQPLLLTVGSHTGAKGHALVMEAFRRARIGPATLVIIGNTLGSAGCLPRCRLQARFVRTASFGKKQVLLLNPPRQDVVSAYHSADLFVFGSNVECSPIVLFEAAASRTPFVTTACGNAAEIAEWTASGEIVATVRATDGLVHTSAGRMACAIEDLFSNTLRRQTMAEAGYEAWRNRFSWEKIAQQYEQLYLQLVEQGPSPALHKIH